jgi:hypothetical protein
LDPEEFLYPLQRKAQLLKRAESFGNFLPQHAGIQRAVPIG